MKKTFQLKSTFKNTLTKVYIGYDLYQEENFLNVLEKINKKFVILCDTHLAKHHIPSIINFMKKNKIYPLVITIDAGEKYKTCKTKEQIEDKMFSNKLGRDTCLIAMGGGVITDLGGFLSATYCRGIPYISIPTSLLGMVDASIGSKTGINNKHGKNLIGLIYPPKAIFIDLSMLNTLPIKEMRNGLSEIIKHGVVSDRHLFSKLFKDFDKWKNRNQEFLYSIIADSCHIKKEVIEKDLTENGLRRILNFGHTIGHAIESLEEYQLSHGESIAIGIITESLISHKLGYLNEQDFDKIYSLFKMVGFPLKISKNITVESMIEKMNQDKKSKIGKSRFVILNGLGKVQSFKGEYCTSIESSCLQKVLIWMLEEFQR